MSSSVDNNDSWNHYYQFLDPAEQLFQLEEEDPYLLFDGSSSQYNSHASNPYNSHTSNPYNSPSAYQLLVHSPASSMTTNLSQPPNSVLTTFTFTPLSATPLGSGFPVQFPYTHQPPIRQSEVQSQIIDSMHAIMTQQSSLSKRYGEDENNYHLRTVTPDSQELPEAASKPKPKGACARCKCLMVRCEFRGDNDTCKRCTNASQECVIPERKPRRTPPKREHLLSQIREQAAQIQELMAVLEATNRRTTSPLVSSASAIMTGHLAQSSSIDLHPPTLDPQTPADSAPPKLEVQDWVAKALASFEVLDGLNALGGSTSFGMNLGSDTPSAHQGVLPNWVSSPPPTTPNVSPSSHLIPPILIPDLTGLITRCSQDPVAGGTYGNIYKCIYHGPDGDVDVAVKAIRLQFFTAEVFRRELGIWKRLRHCNILKFMGTTLDFGPSMALVAPWIVNGTLTSFINQHNETLALRDRLLLLRDIAAGLNYLHTFIFTVDGQVYFNPVVHGDLTGTNVLVGSDGTAYLADFGLSGTLTKSPGMTYLAKMTCHPGAMRWSAPELLSGEDSTSAITTQSDIYSLGNIMLQVLTGSVPWQHLTNDAAILLKVIGGEIHPRPDDSCITDQCWDFMTRCWSMAAIDRPSAEEALQFLDRELFLLQSSDGGPVVDTSLSNDHPSPSPAHFSSPSSSFVRSGCPSPSSTRYMCTALLAGTPDMFHDPVPVPLDADFLEWAKTMPDPLWQDTLVPGIQWMDQTIFS